MFVSKLLERFAYEKLTKSLISKDIPYKHQHGFCLKYSTIHHIIHLLNYCPTSMSKPDPEFALAVLCDLSKAFDVINHDIVLTKMNNYGICGIAKKTQFVEVGGKVSDTVPSQLESNKDLIVACYYI